VLWNDPDPHFDFSPPDLDQGQKMKEILCFEKLDVVI
jgi:hypothetical protein